MKSEKASHPKLKREFGGCVELVSARPDYIEFIDAHRIWGFALNRLTHFVLQENPRQAGRKMLPPDLLVLIYPPATIVLKGWRLELLISPLVGARIARIHAEKHLGTLILEEAWVSEIHVVQPDKIILQPEKLETWMMEQP